MREASSLIHNPDRGEARNRHPREIGPPHHCICVASSTGGRVELSAAGTTRSPVSVIHHAARVRERLHRRIRVRSVPFPCAVCPSPWGTPSWCVGRKP